MRFGSVLVLPLAIVSVFLIASDTTVIRNGETPWTVQGTKPGRVVTQTEVLRITDEGDDFIFKNPRRIKVAPDGAVFVGEREKLLKFDSQGRFLQNCVKRGEGPGEVMAVSDFHPHAEGVVVGAYMPGKILSFAADGALKREFRIPGSFPALKFYLYGAGDKFYLRANNLSPDGLKTGINERSHGIAHCDAQGKITETGLTFTTMDAVLKWRSESGGMAIAVDEITYFITAFDGDRYLYVSHTDKYMITQVDLKTEKIVRKFTRDYRSVPYVKRDDLEDENAKLEEIKNREYYNDVYALRVYRGNILVFTSTMDEAERILVDVFDETGKYIDCFYLRVPGVERPDDLVRKPMCFHDGHFWSMGVDEEDNPYAVKFKLDL
jgi:hypothetical protein